MLSFAHRLTCGFQGGGPSKWIVYLTGITKNQIEYYEPEASSTVVASTAAPQTASTPAVTLGGPTVIVTVPGSEPTQTGSKSESSGPNTAGIAAGVVVGVVVIAAIVGGVYFFLRQRKRKAVEEEYKRNAAVNEFIGGKPPGTSHSSLNDARLDPEAMMHRRQSDGSIADNQDYSRRILRVSLTSMMEGRDRTLTQPRSQTQTVAIRETAAFYDHDLI